MLLTSLLLFVFLIITIIITKAYLILYCLIDLYSFLSCMFCPPPPQAEKMCMFFMSFK